MLVGQVLNDVVIQHRRDQLVGRFGPDPLQDRLPRRIQFAGIIGVQFQQTKLTLCEQQAGSMSGACFGAGSVCGRGITWTSGHLDLLTF